MKLIHTMLVLLAASALWAWPPAFAQGLDEVIVSVTISGALGVGIEASWTLTDHDHVRGGLSVLFHMEEGSSFVQLWPRLLYLRELTPQEPFSLCAGAGLGAFLALVDFPPPMTRPVLELPFGFRYVLSERFNLQAEVRTVVSFFRKFPEFLFLGLTGGVGYGL